MIAKPQLHWPFLQKAPAFCPADQLKLFKNIPDIFVGKPHYSRMCGFNAMAHVNLNPVRARMAETPEKSYYTSIGCYMAPATAALVHPFTSTHQAIF